mgnify:CR=1 FL=1
MTLERIGDHFYTVAGNRVIDRVRINVIAEMCLYTALRQGLDNVLTGSTINDLVQDEWPGSRLSSEDIAVIMPKYKKVLKRAISTLEAHVNEVE